MVEFRSKQELAHDFLRVAILRGDLEPGSRLVIDELASRLGISQIPVREALQQLQAEGFVVIEPHVGARVTEIDAGLVTEVFELLEAMEVISGRAACQRMSEDDLVEIEGLLCRMDALVGEPDRFSEANAHFHQFICDRAKTPLVQSLITKVLDHWDRLRRHYLNDVFVKRVAVAQKGHWRILEALRSRDPCRVEQAIREHARSGLVAYTEYLKETGQVVAGPSAASASQGD
jgi:DNA-binding GntR family transcriptional regulator